MFFLALIAILILGVISFGLLKLLSKSISNQRNQPKQEPETTSSGVNPEQEGNEQIAALIKKIDEYHNKDTKRATADRFEHLMYVLWGFAATAVGFALAMINMPNTNWTIVIIDIIGACIFGGLAIGATVKLSHYRKVDWRDPWSEKD